MYVKLLRKKYPDEIILDVKLKRELVAVLNFQYVDINNGTTNLLKAIELFVINYKKAMIKDDTSLIIYPTINKEYFKYECL